MRTPEGTGMSIEAGSRLVVQIHYHPNGTDADLDVTGLDLMWADAAPGLPAFMALLGNASEAPELLPDPDDRGAPEFRIPAGASGHVETIVYEDLELDQEFTVFAAGTHMHWVGRDMKIVLRHEDGTEECLVQTPAWDFNWQRWYDYAGELSEMPVVRSGDDLVLRCTYDNTLDNPFVREALQEQGFDAPIDVSLGEETLDEMCLAVLGLTLATP